MSDFCAKSYACCVTLYLGSDLIGARASVLPSVPMQTAYPRFITEANIRPVRPRRMSATSCIGLSWGTLSWCPQTSKGDISKWLFYTLMACFLRHIYAYKYLVHVVAAKRGIEKHSISRRRTILSVRRHRGVSQSISGNRTNVILRWWYGAAMAFQGISTSTM